MPNDAKFGLMCGAAVVAILMTLVITQGRALAAAKRSSGTYNTAKLHEHQQTVEGLLWVLGALVVGIEFTTRKFGLAHGWLFWVHLPAAIVWAATFGAAYVMFRSTGAPGAHKWLVYMGIVCGLFAGVTGTILIVTA